MKRALPFVLASIWAAVAAGPGLADPHPTQERGFSLEKAFHVGDVDSINTFNGNLLLTIPIAQLNVSQHLAAPLVLTNNSHVWDTEMREDCSQWQWGCFWYTQKIPERYSNAGLGWLLTFGRLTPPGGLGNNTGRWLFSGATGSEHAFYPNLHEGEPVQSGIFYSRDNSYLRLRIVSGSDRRVEFPDGTVHRFNGDGFLYRIEDPYGNYLSITLVPIVGNHHWAISDNHGRNHTIYFNGPGNRLSSVQLAAFDGTTAIYTFGYTAATIVRDCWHSDPQLGNTVQVQLLTSLTLPDGSQYSMPLSDYGTSNCLESGRVRRMRLPTLGYIAWEYGGGYTFPSESPYWWGDGAGPPIYVWRTQNHGVRKRTLLNANGTAVGSPWLYEPALEVGSDPIQVKEFRNSVTDPAGNTTVHYFSVATHVLSAPWDFREFGLPFTRYETDSTGARFLSTRTFNASGALVRSTYVRYERDQDPPTPGTGVDWRNANRRVASTRRVYHDDGNRFADVTYSSFDGVGNYRTMTTGGNFGAGDTRTVTTNYNPNRGTYPGSFTPVPTTDPWLLNTFNHHRVIEGGVTSHRVDYCFNTSTGFLNRTRTRRLAGTTGAGDIVVVYTGDAQGNVIRERHYGGDKQALASSDGLCTLSLPSSDQYRMDHTYQFGTLRRSQFFFENGTAMNHFTVDRDIDQNTGLVVRERSASGPSSTGIATDFEYDGMGRITWVMPAWSHDGWTEYLYTRATSPSAQANVLIRNRANGSKTASVLAQRRIVFDAFGRPTEERRLGADNLWRSRHTLYNAMGWKASISEWGMASARTQFLQYDPFGRPGTIRPPDGAAHDITLTYFGDREVRRTVRVGTAWNGSAVTESAAITTERYDRQGRLWQVIEPANPDGTNSTVTYSYDAGGNLASVSQTAKNASGGTTTQSRQLTYDQRGFLTGERHPEKGASGNGWVYHSDHDPLGNPGRRVDGPNDLTLSYDRAGRLTLVRESGSFSGCTTNWTSGPRCLKQLVYGTANQTGNFRLGKLQEGRRYNYPALGGATHTIVIYHQYTYGGRQGRVSSRLTTLTHNGGTGAERFSQSWTWNPLGDVASTTYPLCDFPPHCSATQPRTVQSSYTAGWLTGVTGYASLSYHPSLQLDQVVHFNNPGNSATWVTDTHFKDPNNMARPQRLDAKRADGTVLWNSGAYSYDGAGNVVRAGNAYFLCDLVSRVRSGQLLLGPGGGGASQSFNHTYDGFGNLQTLTTVTTRNTPTSATTNRLTGSVAYDAAGNLTYWNGNTYQYDRLGMMTRVASGAETWLYMYDVDDERVFHFKEGASPRFDRWTLRDIDGKVLRTYEGTDFVFTWTEDHVYRGRNLLASVTPAGTTHFHLDHLGTVRAATNASGVRTAYHVYFPFGEEATSISQNAQKMKFTGHERDLGNLASAADDLDYMHARFYNPQLGRFLSVDAVLGTPKKPQTWNRYSYVANNPLGYVDPDGNCAVPAGLREGLVGVCIESFIAAPTVMGVGKGEGRTFVANDPDATYRTSLRMIIEPQSGVILGRETDAGRSDLRGPLSFIGAKGSQVTSIVRGADGEGATFLINIQGLNGLNALNMLGTIDFDVNLRVNKDGGVQGSVERTKAYPSLEGFAYRMVQGQVVTIRLFRITETEIDALNRQKEPPPK